MDLVDVFVQWAPVKRAMEPIVPCILQHEEDADMEEHCGPGRERNASLHSAVLGHGVKQPDLRKLDGKMGEEDELRAVPLLGDGGDLLPLDLVFVKVWDLANNHPGNATTEVDQFVHHEGHNAGGEDVILHVCIPALRGSVSGEL